jgi:hypothetical protein
MPYQPAQTAATAQFIGMDYGLGSYTVASNAISQANIYYHTVTVTGASSGNYLGSYQTMVYPQVITNQMEYHYYQGYGQINQPALTPEEILENQKRVEAFQAEQEKIAARARETLEKVLDDDQKHSLHSFKWFDVKVSGRVYRIKPGYKVERLDDAGKAVSLYCIHPSESLPADDIAISQKLWLETDEATFLKVANETRL